MKEAIHKIIAASVDTKQQLLKDDSILEAVEDIVELIVSAFRQGNRVYFCGNGGSAADAQHLSAEFTGRFYKDRKALPAEALHVNTSYLTAVANDYGYDQVYARIIEGIGQPGDVLIALSTSGNSENIILALEVAIRNQIHTVGFSGQSGGRMNDYCQIMIKAPSTDTPRIQECHMLLGHIICQLVEANYFAS